MTDTDLLIALLRESKRMHYHANNSFYCCPKCTDHPHFTNGDTVGKLWSTSADTQDCTCGADEWNARVDAVLK